MKQRSLYLVKFLIVTILISMVAKIFFMLYNHANHHFSFIDVVRVIQHGLSLDFSTSLYFLIVPFLLIIISLWMRIPKWVFVGYYIIAATLLSLAFVADTSLYEFWQFKLDASCLSYLETPTEAMASVSIGYVLARFLCILLCGIVICWIYDRLTPKFVAVKHRLIGTFVFLLMIPFIIIGIRGGLDESTTNVGQVYFSQNQFLNHAAINPIFSFLSSMEKTASYVPDYRFMDNEECNRLVSKYYPTESIGSEILLNTQSPNVVVILMESCGAIFTGLEGQTDVMPNLNQLMQDGVSFDSCYANSWRTDRGTVCTYSGYPSFPISSVMKMPSKTRVLPGLARTLSAEGYQTAYFYGGDINFTNMRSYLVGTGFEQLTWKKNFSTEEQQSAKWGVRDDIMFRELVSQIIDYDAKGQKFFIGFSTLSSHEPWDVPLKKKEDEILNAFYYLDHCIGTFVDALKQTPAWKNLLIILLADHSIDYKGVGIEDSRYAHIPMVWIGGAIKTPQRVLHICNQTDLPATLLGQLGLCHTDFRYSRDVMSSNFTYPVAIHTYNNGVIVIENSGRTIFDLTANRMIWNKGLEEEKRIRIGKAVLQSAAYDLKNMK